MAGYAVQNPALDSFLVEDRHPFIPVFKGRDLDVDACERIERARTNQVLRPMYQEVLAFYDELIEKGEGYLDRARVREAEANYLQTVAIEHPHREREMLRLAELLRRARDFGVWQVAERLVYDDAGELVVDHALKCEWYNRAGLVKLCPDDAREEAMRVSSIYAPRIEAAQRAGYEVHYAVATFPNSPRGFLAADLRAIKQRVRDWIVHARTDGKIARSTKDAKRIFFSLKGVLATVEAPLSRHGDWNVHVNLILIFTDRPDYGALREQWGANIDFQWIKAGAGAAAIRELVKYPLQAVSFKSQAKADAGRSHAPPMIEWPTEAFLEWWDAHKRYRRTCSWGELFAGAEEPLSPWLPSAEPIGRMFLSPAGFRAEPPMIDTHELDEAQEMRAERERIRRDRRMIDMFGTRFPDAAQRELFDAAEAREREQRELVRRLDRWISDDAEGGVVDLILGNKSASAAPLDGPGPPLQSE